MIESTRLRDTFKPVRFSLRSLLIFITGLSIALGILAWPVLLMCIVAFAYVTSTGALIVAVWKGRGWIQAFAVGATLPHLLGYLFLLASRRPIDLSIMALMAIVVSIVSGVVTAAAHGALVRRKGTIPVPDLPIMRDLFSNLPGS